MTTNRSCSPGSPFDKDRDIAGDHPVPGHLGYGKVDVLMGREDQGIILRGQEGMRDARTAHLPLSSLDFYWLSLPSEEDATVPGWWSSLPSPVGSLIAGALFIKLIFCLQETSNNLIKGDFSLQILGPSNVQKCFGTYPFTFKQTQESFFENHIFR